MTLFQNPILPGMYPDPSVCRVGDDYYMVTSTFEYFPGVPIFHSRDLVHWRQLGHVLDRPSQLNLDGVQTSRGIYAATLRYHNGVFYMITTLVESATSERRNFYVTASDPSGPWSDPYWLEDAPGIDPSLFFDDDGRAYFTANRRPPEGQHYPKHMEIYMQELDLHNHRLIGPRYSLWDGALKFIHAQEGPHVYKVDGYYYLFIAEGGTGFTHSVTVARSREITGPYEGAKTNPILTHRHLGQEAAITNVGHGDIVQTGSGQWWMVCLGTRPYGGGYRNLGRETFLVPLAWEKGWPVVNPGKGIVETQLTRPNLPACKWPLPPVCDSFDRAALDMRWSFVRTPRGDFWSLTERPGHLRLRLKPDRLTDWSNPAVIARRQQHKSFAARTVMEFTPRANEEAAGLVLLQTSDFHLRFEYAMAEGQRRLRLVECRNREERVLASQPLEAGKLYLRVEADEQRLRFDYALEAEAWIGLSDGVDGTLLSPDVAGSFLGAFIGLYAGSSGQASNNYADFDWFEYAAAE
ncbi:Non-reducing end alpha-L-arabinofuranosidase BoGH43B [Paenibacillus solanacearum]|uniref:Non-reducing end alpha-L-arabinofuranosidase BoGH43B n=1 Tax=Paenibacillus solanacearum TaxID=2048548 RepID=A0A916K633_9BACL|nr:glycoside hydrolase family 43 protein [Paenibacillus solanacearum]CAG7644381.1 Non-reducing end alpha-L-arabinofuranosidase BoGH43B [Paenibacillus solanacearum]